MAISTEGDFSEKDSQNLKLIRKAIGGYVIIIAAGNDNDIANETTCENKDKMN